MKYLLSLFFACFLFIGVQAQSNEDCINAQIICDDGQIDFNPMGIGEDDFENPNNFAGCLQTNEVNSAWYIFTINSAAPNNLELGFTIDPNGGQGEDYDFAIWGPDLECDSLGEPLRCSYAGSGCDFCPLTGLGMGAIDVSEDPLGDGFVANLIVNPGETYLLMVDNFAGSSLGFSLEWTEEGAEWLNCTMTCEIEAEMEQEEFILCNGGDSVFLDLNITGDEVVVTYQWTGDNIEFLSDDTVEDPFVTIPEDFIGVLEYTVFVQDTAEECSATTQVTIIVNLCVDPVEIVHYDLNACNAGQDETNVYQEFTAEILTETACGEVFALFAQREDVNSYRHSCTPGVDNSIAMCFSASEECDYDEGGPFSLRFEITVIPEENVSFQLSNLSFYEKAPMMYDWINGGSGLNDPPEMYGVSVYANSVLIFTSADNPTTADWSLEEFDFSGMDEFVVTEETVFSFELQGYCLLGTGAEVHAWDIDEIGVSFSCMSDEGLMSDIGGLISSVNKNVMPGITTLLVSQEDGETLIQQTDENGRFAFDHMYMYEEYSLSAHKNDDSRNGISTLDIVYIMKHLLGQKRFESPYQFIAADINNNGEISASDMVELRKLLLGQIDQFESNTSWRFLANSFALNTSNWMDATENLEVNPSIVSSSPKLTAVKIGDLNSSANLNEFHSESEVRTDKSISFNTTRVMETGSVVYEVRAEDFSDVSGFQFSINHGKLEFVELISGVISLNESNIHADEELSISWASADQKSIESNEVLFSLVFKETNSIANKALSLGTVMSSEGYVNTELDIIDIEFETRNENQDNLESSSLSISPMPFNDEVLIKLENVKETELELRLVDALGHLVLERSWSPSIKHEIVLRKDELTTATTDVLFYQIQAGEKTYTGKLVIVE